MDFYFLGHKVVPSKVFINPSGRGRGNRRRSNISRLSTLQQPNTQSILTPTEVQSFGENIPDEILVQICQNLDDQSLARFQLSYSRAYQVCKDIIVQRKLVFDEQKLFHTDIDFKDAINKLIMEIHPDMVMSEDAANFVNDLLNQLLRMILEAVKTTESVETVIENILGGELSIHALKEDLSFPLFKPEEIRKRLISVDIKESEINKADKITNTLANVLAYICAELLELSGNVKREIEIDPEEEEEEIERQSVVDAIESDLELSKIPFKNVIQKKDFMPRPPSPYV